MNLAAHTGLGDAMERWHAAFGPRLAATAEATLDGLARSGWLRDGGRELTAGLEMPRAFADMLAAAVALEEREASGRAQALLCHYTELMPRMRVEQLATRAAPAATLLQAPLEWDKMPHLSCAVDRLYALFGESGGGSPPCGAPDAAALRARFGTVAELYAATYYGGFMPLLYGYPADLAHFARALGAGASLPSVLDRYLAAPLIHELSHFGRARAVFPLHLDECVAGYLGVRVLPTFAYPAPDEDNGLYAAPWFAQVGQALVRACGLAPVLAAHAGARAWDAALPPGLAVALMRLGWSDYLDARYLHFLSDNFRPDPWMKLFFLGAAGAPLEGCTLSSLAALPWCDVPAGEEAPLDEQMLADALSAMCLRNHQVERSFRVSTRLPRAPIDVDLAACRVSTAPGEDGYDPAGLAYLFPPAVAARLRGRGIAGYTIELRRIDALDELKRALLDGAAGRDTASYTLVRRS